MNCPITCAYFELKMNDDTCERNYSGFQEKRFLAVLPVEGGEDWSLWYLCIECETRASRIQRFKSLRLSDLNTKSQTHISSKTNILVTMKRRRVHECAEWKNVQVQGRETIYQMQTLIVSVRTSALLQHGIFLSVVSRCSRCSGCLQHRSVLVTNYVRKGQSEGRKAYFGNGSWKSSASQSVVGGKKTTTADFCGGLARRESAFPALLTGTLSIRREKGTFIFLWRLEDLEQ